MSLKAYKAAAGSGKTTILVIEYLSLALLKPNNFRQIIALTFTIKATKEMKERLLKYLNYMKSMNIDSIDSNYEHIISSIQTKTMLNTSEIKQRAKILLENILHNYSDFGFSTIDSFVVKIVKSFTYDLKLSANFDIELDSKVLIEEAINNIYDEVGKDSKLTDFILNYTLEQLEDERSFEIEEPLHKLGGLIFDSKHYKDIEDIKDIPLENFIKIKQILRNSIKEYGQSMYQLGIDGLKQIKTLNIEEKSFSSSWLPSYYKKLIKLKDEFISTDKIENKTFLKTINGESGWYAKSKKGEQYDLIDANKDGFLEHITKSREFYHQETPKFLGNLLILRKITPMALIHELKQIINKNGEENEVIHLSEINRKISEIVKEQQAPFIYERIGQRYRHFLIDEFQDTSIIQWNNMLPLIINSLADGNKNFIVGDAKQSIYRWRDGDVEQFVRLPLLANSKDSSIAAESENLLKQTFEVENLSTNYRSFDNIIYFNNQLFNQILKRSSEYVRNFFENHNQDFAKKENKGYITVTKKEKDDDTAELVLKRVKVLIDEHNYKKGDICIIDSTNKKLSNYAEILLNNGIDVVSADALYFYNSEIISYIISFMQLIKEIDISINSYNICNFLIKGSEQSFNKVDELINFLNKNSFDFNLDKINSLDSYEFSEYIIEKAKINKLNNPYIYQFLDLIHLQTKKSGSSINNFLKFWEEKHQELKIEMPETKDAVNLYTVHKSKGLEFPAVIFPFLGYSDFSKERTFLWIKPDKNLEGLSPKLLISDEKKGLESIYKDEIEKEKTRQELDNLNMVYVACTRAEEQLHIISENKNKDNGEWDNIFNLIHWDDERHVIKEENFLSIGKEYIRDKHQEKHNNEGGGLIIEEYINKHWEGRIKLKKDISAFDYSANREKGIQLHSLLSQFYNDINIDEFIDNAIKTGVIEEANKDEFVEILTSLINTDSIKKFFDRENKRVSEKAILTPDNEVFIPDLVIQKNNIIFIVDFKYADFNSISEYEKEKYKKQVYNYSKLVAEIEEKEVESYLLYLHNNIELISV